MAISSAIDTLIELATTETDEAAKRLGRITRAAEECEKKLAMLHQYRDDYMTRYQASLAIGLTAMGMRNFQLFLAKLDTAIDAQKKVVLEVQQRIVIEREAWPANASACRTVPLPRERS
jgi:flagellar protein FliJ